MSKKSRNRKKKDCYINWLKKQATELQVRKQSEILRNVFSKRIDELFQSQLVSKLSAHLKKLPPKLDTPVAAIDIKQLQGMDKKELIEIIISYQKLTATCESIMKADQSFRNRVFDLELPKACIDQQSQNQKSDE